ncbi:uncharacterized protein LOC108050260 [Drosophila rhopaloa]|uniref:Uncharacterized protein LOC108050260 n=1 Tax=Drosophila rhopaloa TaxID=1041015 RepID=A0A6P4FDS6_DRORH|nr:uncharacterized protein LOC108050260 [Drosophila rhopaloa]
MIWKFLICCLLGHSFVIGIGAKCLRSTGHMWQLKPPTGSTSCSRPSLLPRNATATEKPASTTVDIGKATMEASVPEVAESLTAPPAVILANYVYECASRRTASTCSQQPEKESKPEFKSGPESEVAKPQTATLAVGELEGFRPTV